MRRSSVLSLPLQLAFPGKTHQLFFAALVKRKQAFNTGTRSTLRYVCLWSFHVSYFFPIFHHFVESGRRGHFCSESWASPFLKLKTALRWTEWRDITGERWDFLPKFGLFWGIIIWQIFWSLAKMFALATFNLITPPINCHKVKVFRLWKNDFFTKIWTLFVIIWQTFATASALTTFILCAPKPQISKDKKTDCLRFVMCPLLEPGFQDFFFFVAIKSSNEANKAGGTHH